jgi:hypothetical protein
MDFLALCQGLGLALAAGLLVGVVLPPIMPNWGVIAGAAPLAVIGCGLALNGADEAVWPALPIGVLAGGLAALVSRDVAAGAARREAQGAEAVEASAPAGITAIVALAAVALALVSLFVPPVALVAAAAIFWLWLNRRRRAEQKHEGLRVLR